jgi:hypothetical protein
MAAQNLNSSRRAFLGNTLKLGAGSLPLGSSLPASAADKTISPAKKLDSITVLPELPTRVLIQPAGNDFKQTDRQGSRFTSDYAVVNLVSTAAGQEIRMSCCCQIIPRINSSKDQTYLGLLVLLWSRPKRTSVGKTSGEVKSSCRRHAACYIANTLQDRKCYFSRRMRQRLYLAAGVLSLAIWLFMAAAELCTPLHALLHGGTIPVNDDDCAIVAIAHGKVETVVYAAPEVVPVIGIEITPRLEFSTYRITSVFLPDGRGPPVSLLPS